MTAPLRFAMVGAGWWAHRAHLPALAADASIEFIAVCDPNESRANAAAREFGATAAFTDVAAMIDAVEIDCAVVATPHTTHRPIVEALLRAGVDVLVEKPLATTADDAWSLVELARELGRTLSVGLTYQYAETAAQVREIVATRIGELVCVNAEFSSQTEGLFGTADPAAAHLDDPSVPHGVSYADPRLSGGGQGQTQLTHLLGNLLWNTGKQAREVFAYMNNRGLAVDVVDALTFRLDDGAIGTASSTGTTPEGSAVRHRIRYHGTRAVLEHDLLTAEAWLFEAGGGIRHIENPHDQPAYALSRPVPTFARVVRGEIANPAPADVAAASVALIEAAYISAAEHRPVQVPRGAVHVSKEP
ncbi:Gfo/Idh/MocA family oxidoreductase [Microbacterium sp. STN6]|uniref:Gfo/Idh/MocA family protein n=1 Tax=Microbacterium sp. STN6 TaxID=2995588 RepID=UPI002260ECAC|nr:Gfo/Idh/MocA family oxidoreductase [Microbacterium sp. STN6]MCX7522547.1 Gfo/Idh/MocA family oxidoreductase [Microbacterium sp. STN6]